MFNQDYGPDELSRVLQESHSEADIRAAIAKRIAELEASGVIRRDASRPSSGPLKIQEILANALSNYRGPTNLPTSGLTIRLPSKREDMDTLLKILGLSPAQYKLLDRTIIDKLEQAVAAHEILEYEALSRNPDAQAEALGRSRGREIGETAGRVAGLVGGAILALNGFRQAEPGSVSKALAAIGSVIVPLLGMEAMAVGGNIVGAEVGRRLSGAADARTPWGTHTHPDVVRLESNMIGKLNDPLLKDIFTQMRTPTGERAMFQTHGKEYGQVTDPSFAGRMAEMDPSNWITQGR